MERYDCWLSVLDAFSQVDLDEKAWQRALVELPVLSESKATRAPVEMNGSARLPFASMAPQLRSAVQAQVALEYHGMQLLSGALDALGLVAFICDRAGAVRAMTPRAEELIAREDALTLKRGELRSSSSAESAILAEAVARAVTGSVEMKGSLASAVFIQAQPARLILDVVPLPRRKHALGFEPRALVIVRNRRPDEQRVRHLLQSAYRLTPAEADVAVRIAAGDSPGTVALARNTSLGTVRVQIRALFVKLGVRRQSELVARINDLH